MVGIEKKPDRSVRTSEAKNGDRVDENVRRWYGARHADIKRQTPP